jgi:hypothetical protein
MGSIANMGGSRKHGMGLAVCALSEKLKKYRSRKYFSAKTKTIKPALAFLRGPAS